MAKSARTQLLALEKVLRDMESVVVAYSGGIDSTLVAVVAHRVLGPRALAVTAVSPALAARELEEATGLARRFGFSHQIIHTKEMEREGYVANSSRRCYFCKTELYADLRKLAQDKDYTWIANGTNTDDLGDYRPGLQAASEHQVRSPMVETGLGKEMVRRLARDLGIPTWDKPAQPCLSSRIPYGTPVTVEALSRIERAEDYLRDLGLREVRVRHHDRLCRIEMGEREMELAFARRQEIVENLKRVGYLWVSLDLAGLRSGSLNDQLKSTALVRPQ